MRENLTYGLMRQGVETWETKAPPLDPTTGRHRYAAPRG